MSESAGRLTLRANELEFSALGAGSAGEPLVLCLHGFPDNAQTFRPQISFLADNGFRVVAPTLRGYEPSSQPTDDDYSLEAIANDVVGWLDDLGVERAHLVGHDWGAAIAYVVAARNPERLLTMTAMAVPPLARIPHAVRKVPRQIQRSWYMTFFQLPGVSERALAAGDWWLLRRLWRSWSPGHRMSETDWRALRRQFERPGVATAALRYYRQNATPLLLLGARSTPAMERTEIGVSTLVINGADDGCMDKRLFDAAIRRSDHPAGVRHETIEGAGHFVHLERPDEVNELLLAHLR